MVQTVVHFNSWRGVVHSSAQLHACRTNTLRHSMHSAPAASNAPDTFSHLNRLCGAAGYMTPCVGAAAWYNNMTLSAQAVPDINNSHALSYTRPDVNRKKETHTTSQACWIRGHAPCMQVQETTRVTVCPTTCCTTAQCMMMLEQLTLTQPSCCAQLHGTLRLVRCGAPHHSNTGNALHISASAGAAAGCKTQPRHPLQADHVLA